MTTAPWYRRPVGSAIMALALAIALLVGARGFVTGCSAEPPAHTEAPAAEEDVVRVMTYNLNYALDGHQAGAKAIRAGNADVVLLQEVTEGWRELLQHEFAERYKHTAFDIRPERHGMQEHRSGGGLGIMSVHPIETVEYLEPPEGGWFPAQRIELDTPQGPVEVLNLHLRPPRTQLGGVAVGLFWTSTIRHRQIETYTEHLHTEHPTLVVGDFNESTRSNTLAFLRDRGFRCALCQADSDVGTWRLYTSLGMIRRQIDHVTYEHSAFERVEIRVLRAGLSDHLPLVVDLRSRATPDPT